MNWLSTAFGRIVGFLPNLLGGLVVLGLGVLLAYLLARLARPLLHRVGFDAFLARHGILRRTPDARAGSNAVASAIFWVTVLAALMQACRVWNLGIVAGGLARVLGYLPHVLAAVLIFGATYILANWVRARMQTGAMSPRMHGTLLPGAVRAGILTLGAFVALRELAIAPAIVTIGFALAFGCIAVATALAFGLGGRRVAEQVTEDWYGRAEMEREPLVHGETAVGGREEPGLPEEKPPEIH